MKERWTKFHNLCIGHLVNFLDSPRLPAVFLRKGKYYLPKMTKNMRSSKSITVLFRNSKNNDLRNLTFTPRIYLLFIYVINLSIF